MVVGPVLGMIAGALYLLSLHFAHAPATSIAILLVASGSPKHLERLPAVT
jgi:hypothetical protein